MVTSSLLKYSIALLLQISYILLKNKQQTSQFSPKFLPALPMNTNKYTAQYTTEKQNITEISAGKQEGSHRSISSAHEYRKTAGQTTSIDPSCIKHPAIAIA
jgi:hypothetical protein